MVSLKLFTGSSNPELAHKIAAELEIDVGDADVTRFSDGEVDVRINESVRACDVFIIQSTSYPVNDHLMELMLLADVCRRRRLPPSPPYYLISVMEGRIDKRKNGFRSPRKSWPICLRSEG